MKSQHGNAENAGWSQKPTKQPNKQTQTQKQIEMTMIFMTMMIMIFLMIMMNFEEPGWGGGRLDGWGPSHNCCWGKGR